MPQSNPRFAAQAAPASGTGDPLHLLCLGQSQLACLRRALTEADTAQALAAAQVQITVIVMNDPHFDPHFTAGHDAPDGMPHFSPALQAEIDLASAKADAVYTSIGGTAHCVLGMLEHERPFDFTLEHDPAVPLLPGREPVPGAMVREALAATSLFRHQRALRRFLPTALQRPVVHLESSPPLPQDQVVNNLGGYRRLLTPRGVAPASVRRKLWRLHSQMVAEDCAAAGIEFLPVPDSVQDETGQLLPQALSPGDPTHANDWYGRRMIEQIVSRHRPGFSIAEQQP
ncbi:hypothetical protein [Ideonella sp.]|uniref:hypothetical protein n=1 Tax=Ideonella sp. TaxID=1929293 RepID=UPI003BB63D34